MARKFLAQIGIIAGISAFGIAVSFATARVIELRQGRASLQRYAEQLRQADEGFIRDDDQAIEDIAHDGLPFCSDAELSFLRDYVFRSPHIRDIGRLKDGALYCTSGVGRLPSPTVSTSIPDFSENGVHIFTHGRLKISNDTQALIIQTKGVSLALNAKSYLYLDEAPMYFAGPLLDRTHGQLLTAFGHSVPLSAQEAMAGKLIERKGVFYQPICLPQATTCVIGFESRKDMLATNKDMVGWFLVGGLLLGGALGLILVQFHHGHSSMESQLRRAIQKDSLTLVYQPIIDLETNAIVGAEALVRWINEDGESVRPEVFIALAEQRGFVGQITQRVARCAVEELGDLLKTGTFRLTLNISSEDLHDARFVANLDSALGKSGVPAASIGLELTERFAADQERAMDTLALIKSKGYMVYIDDFGTGYSSLAYLHRLQVDAIKIDRTFTQTVGTEAVTASVVPQILDMAAKLGLLVVVEGIETKKQAEYFRASGRGILGQGWLFGKPVPVAQFRKLLA